MVLGRHAAAHRSLLPPLSPALAFITNLLSDNDLCWGPHPGFVFQSLRGQYRNNALGRIPQPVRPAHAIPGTSHRKEPRYAHR